MISICFYFEVHQPYRLRKYGFFDLGNSNYFDDEANARIAEKVANKCYRPTTSLLYELVKRHGDEFRFTFSVTGTAIEQFKRWTPDVMDLFRALAETGRVEF
ncbi:MAG TPA: alpha-amylase, partial [Leptospiraceae bacterium]|nr:alpha-amylase [Leptospiraceae bacterium]